MEIVEGVHTVESLGVGRAYIYQEQDKLTLIDTGLANSTEKILAVVGKIGRKPEDIRQIFITHHHNDHTGSLAELVERTGAQVLAHKIEAPVVRGEQQPPQPKLTGLRSLLRRLMGNSVQPGARVSVDRELEDGDEVDIGGGANVLHVPGHTMGSVALFIPKHRILFAGDAAVSVIGLGPPAGPFGLFNEDSEQALDSFKRR
ncbi:MAG: MBL fold metallo-hydrolase, partial [Chloroflexi bacterium]|nr:MBL fold metallo-hydrolase [Chloroflexota bacterium]